MPSAKAGLAQPRALDSVMRAIAFVEERFADSIGVADVADAACYSPFYFSRLFSEATGHAPYDYLIRRRVAIAARALVDGDRGVTEIALEHGFEVPDSFARAFKRCFGLLPSEARKVGFFPSVIARTRVERPYVAAMLEGRVGAPSRVEEGARFETPRGAFEPVREYAYRAWLPMAAPGFVPRFEIVERDPETEEPIALVLPIA
jgi:AraC-type DNA-binding domain-containing proteins